MANWKKWSPLEEHRFWMGCDRKLPRGTTSALNSVTILKTDFDLQRFWEIQEVHSPKQLAAEETQCEQHFLEPHKKRKTEDPW